MTAAVFTARDARWRRHLLTSLGDALEDPELVEFVAGRAYEGEDTSLYLWTFYFIGARDGIDVGREKERDEAFDYFYGHKAADVAARATARRDRVKRARRAKKAGRQ